MTQLDTEIRIAETDGKITIVIVGRLPATLDLATIKELFLFKWENLVLNESIGVEVRPLEDYKVDISSLSPRTVSDEGLTLSENESNRKVFL